MKNKSTTIILVILIIALIGCGIAFGLMNKSSDSDSTTTTQQPTESSTQETEQEQTTVPLESTTVEESSTENQFGVNQITVNEVFTLLDEYYGGNYDINCVDKNAQMPVFEIVDSKTGEQYASVKVNLGDATATETLNGSNKTNEFSLIG